MNKNKKLIVLGVIVILLIACIPAETTSQLATTIPVAPTPTLAPLPAPTGCATSVINIPGDMSLDWRVGGENFDACNISVEISSASFADYLYYKFQNGESVQISGGMLKVTFDDGDGGIYYFAQHAGGVMQIAAEAAPQNTFCAVEVLNPPTDTSLNWQPAGTEYDACDISISEVSSMLYYSFQGGHHKEIYADSMLRVMFSDLSVKYFTVNDKGQLMMAE